MFVTVPSNISLYCLIECWCPHDRPNQRYPNHRYHHSHHPAGYLCSRNGMGGQGMMLFQSHNRAQHGISSLNVQWICYWFGYFVSPQAQIFLLIVLITAIINYFIGTFIPLKSKESFGFFGYDSMTTPWFVKENRYLCHFFTLSGLRLYLLWNLHT